jgi:rubrerythrin
MDLATFGAIMTFAMELETEAISFYKKLSEDSPAKLPGELFRSSQKRWRRLERARREGISEMILESITGLDSDAYSTVSAEDIQTTDWQKGAQNLEATYERFYNDAAAKLPIKEISRLFARLAKDNRKRKERIESLGAEGP